MNEWKNASEELPTLEKPVLAGWFDAEGSFVIGLFVRVYDGNDVLWCCCSDSTSFNGFGDWLIDDDYPVSHWMYLPNPPKE